MTDKERIAELEVDAEVSRLTAELAARTKERDAVAEKLAVCVEMPDEDIPLVKESEIWRAWLSERNAAFIQIVEQDKALERIAAAFKEIQKRCPECKGEGYVTTYASDGFPEGEECERCNIAADTILAAMRANALRKAAQEYRARVKQWDRFDVHQRTGYAEVAMDLDRMADAEEAGNECH
jgi:excinuclease UvrABC ATPase subunit